jgi:integrase
MATTSKLQTYLDRKPKANTIKNFDQAFEFACEKHPKWALNRDKKSQAENVRRHHRQLQTHMDGEPIPLKVMDTRFIYDVTADIKDDRNWLDSSANRFISTISVVFDCLADEQLIDSKPHIIRYDEPEGRTQWFTKEQVDAMCDIAKRHGRDELADLVLFAAYTGLRQAEIRRLRACDFDFRLEQPFIHVGGTPDTKTKTNNYRQVGINDRLIPMVQRLLDGAKQTDLVFGDYWSNRQRINRAFNRTKEFLMYRDDTVTRAHVFHTLRHSYGTWQIAAGTPVMHVQQTMGHSNVKTTERYVHNTYASVVNCANAI